MRIGRIPLLTLLLLLLAFALRVWQLDYQDIWGDEAWSIAISATTPWQESLFMEANPPFYFLLLRGARALWGSSPFALRYLSVLTGLLAVPLIALTGRLAAGRTGKNALFHATLLVAAIQPFLIWYAQEARMYGPLIVGGAGSLYWFARLTAGPSVVRQPKGQEVAPSGRSCRGVSYWWGGMALWFAFSAVAVFSHYYALAIPLAQALWLFGRKVRHPATPLRPWLTGWIALALPFLLYLWYHRQVWGSQTERRFAEWDVAALLEIGRRTLAAYGAGTTLHPHQTGWAWAIAALALIGAVALVWRGRHAGLLLLATATGIGLAWFLTPLLPFFWERYLFGSLPPFLALVGAGMAAPWMMGEFGRKQPLPAALWSLAAAALVIAASAVALHNHYRDPAFVKGGYGQLMRAIADQAQPGDVILLNGPLQASLFDYYRPTGLPWAMLPRDRLLTDADALAAVGEAAAGQRRAWLVESGNPAEYDPDGRARGALAHLGGFTRKLERPGVAGWLFVLESADTPLIPRPATVGDGIALRGYTVSADTLLPADTLLVSLIWEALAPLPRDYTVFVHLIAPDGSLIAQADGQPVGGNRPTSGWQPGETLRDRYALALPATLPPGPAMLRVGLYAWPELERLPVQQAGEGKSADAILLQMLTLEPQR